MTEYCININSVEADQAVERVLERLSARAKELCTVTDTTYGVDYLLEAYAFNRLQEAIECELVVVRATKQEGKA